MKPGDKVVCVNDVFTAPVRCLYKQLPVEGHIYTVRKQYLGREKLGGKKPGYNCGLLLEEIVNPEDPFHKEGQELGFSIDRFAPVVEVPEEDAVVYEGDEAFA